MTIYGYARVSTGGQSVDAQARQLRAGAGTVFREVAGGVAVDRPQLVEIRCRLWRDRFKRKRPKKINFGHLRSKTEYP